MAVQTFDSFQPGPLTARELNNLVDRMGEFRAEDQQTGRANVRRNFWATIEESGPPNDAGESAPDFCAEGDKRYWVRAVKLSTSESAPTCPATEEVVHPLALPSQSSDWDRWEHNGLWVPAVNIAEVATGNRSMVPGEVVRVEAIEDGKGLWHYAFYPGGGGGNQMEFVIYRVVVDADDLPHESDELFQVLEAQLLANPDGFISAFTLDAEAVTLDDPVVVHPHRSKTIEQWLQPNGDQIWDESDDLADRPAYLAVRTIRGWSMIVGDGQEWTDQPTQLCSGG